MSVKNVVLMAASLLFLSAIGVGKWKLATMGSSWIVIFLGAIVFVISNPTKVASSEIQKGK